MGHADGKAARISPCFERGLGAGHQRLSHEGGEVHTIPIAEPFSISKQTAPRGVRIIDAGIYQIRTTALSRGGWFRELSDWRRG